MSRFGIVNQKGFINQKIRKDIKDDQIPNKGKTDFFSKKNYKGNDTQTRMTERVQLKQGIKKLKVKTFYKNGLYSWFYEKDKIVKLHCQ